MAKPQVIVLYQGFPNPATDQAIEEASDKEGGEKVKGGYGLLPKTRDLTYKFKSAPRAEAFIKTVKEMTGITKAETKVPEEVG